jgi:site-specific recombinase XerD
MTTHHPSLDRFRRDLEARGLAANTVDAYVLQVRRFVAWLAAERDRRPSRARESDVRDYVGEQLRRYAPQTVNQTTAALRGFYMDTLRRPVTVARLGRVRVKKTLPVVLSPGEVARLLAATTSLKYRTIFSLQYGAGLRVGEACSLEVGDIDSARMLLRIRHSKGHPREVPMSARLLTALRTYWRAERPAQPMMFPGRLTGRPLTRAAVKQALDPVVQAAAIDRHVTTHTLRHSYATHMLDAGADLRTVQVLLGHAYVSSTTHYTQLSRARLSATPSPLDSLDLRVR